MREIVFRGKAIDGGKWEQGGIVHQTDFYGNPVDRYFIIDGTTTQDYDIGYETEVCQDTVSQKVGPFFEGDIIDYMGARFLIEYDPATQAFIGRSLERNSFVPLSKHIVELSDVIGNRWDNPELLTK